MNENQEKYSTLTKVAMSLFQGFVIIGVKSPSTGVRSFRCVVGQESVDVRQKGLALIDSAQKAQQEVDNLLEMSVERSGEPLNIFHKYSGNPNTGLVG